MVLHPADQIDKCGLQPGSCEGSVILAQAGGVGEVRLAIQPRTRLKRADQLITIEELGVGNYVMVEAVQIPGQPLQQITVLSAGRSSCAIASDHDITPDTRRTDWPDVSTER